MTERLCGMAIQSNVFKRWELYHDQKLRSRSAKYKAECFYRTRLMQRTLNVFSENVTRQKGINRACYKLVLFYKRVLMSNAWTKWTLITGRERDSELRIKFLKAKYFCEKGILEKYFFAWSKYTDNRCRERILKARALNFYKDLCFKKCMRIWKSALTKEKQSVALEEKALEFYHVSLIQSCIRSWMEAYNYSISLKKMLKRAVSHSNKKLLNKFIIAWIEFCNVKIQKENAIQGAELYHRKKSLRKCFKEFSKRITEGNMKREKLQRSENLYAAKLLQRTFLSWKKYHRQTTEWSAKIKQFDCNVKVRLKQKTLLYWRLYLMRKKCNDRNIFLSVNHYRKQLLIKMLHKLRCYLRYRQNKKAGLTYLGSRIEKILYQAQRIYFIKWRDVLVDAIREKQKISKIEEFRTIRLTKRYFYLWILFFQRYKAKLLRKRSLQDTVTSILLKKYISIWYKRYRTASKDRLKEKMVISVGEMKIKFKHFESWKSYVEGRKRKSMEIEAAKEFYRKLIVREGLKQIFRNCLHRTELRYKNQLQNVMRNSAQEFEIVKKFFNKWLTVIYCNDCVKATDKHRVAPQTSKVPIPTDLVCAKRMHLVGPKSVKDNRHFLSTNGANEKIFNTKICEDEEISCKKLMVKSKNIDTCGVENVSGTKKVLNSELIDFNKRNGTPKRNACKYLNFANYSFVRQGVSSRDVDNEKLQQFCSTQDSSLKQMRFDDSKRVIVSERRYSANEQNKQRPWLDEHDDSVISRLYSNRNYNIFSENVSDFRTKFEVPSSNNDLTPDSLKSNLDSGRTYTVQSPVFLRRSIENYPPDYFQNSNFVFESKNQNLILLPPSVFTLQKR